MADKPRPDTMESTLDPALSEALDDLERMLGDGDELDKLPDDLEDDAFGEDENIPLLRPVEPVGPGIDQMGAADRLSSAPESLALDDHAHAELVDRVSQRLASELDVIATDCVSQVLAQVEGQVTAQIAARVREHLAIVLPEIIDDLSR